MASTRNKNTPGNYCLDQRQNTGSLAWLMYEHGGNGYAYDTRLAGNGLNPGQMPWTTLSYNAADIESFLFGINSTNLVTPAASCFVPHLKELRSADVFPTKPVLMPVPQVILKNERPFPAP